jgi:hypothetical protein
MKLLYRSTAEGKIEPVRGAGGARTMFSQVRCASLSPARVCAARFEGLDRQYPLGYRKTLGYRKNL